MTGARIFRFNEFQTNCMVIWDNTKSCAIFDPGFNSEEDRAQLYDLISSEQLKPAAVLLTHGHFDHIYGVSRLVKDFNVPVYMNPADKVVLAQQNPMVAQFGMAVPDSNFATIDALDGDSITVGGIVFKVLATPGHTPGGVSYLDEADKVIVSGDTLFAGSIGRSDFPGGDYDALIDGIMTKLMALDGDIDVLPGHGPYTTIADERQKNPFLQPFNEPYEDKSEEAKEQ